MFGFPVTTKNGKYEIVKGLPIDAFSQERINKTLKELQDEQAGVAHLLVDAAPIAAAATHPRDSPPRRPGADRLLAGLRPLQRRRGADAQEPAAAGRDDRGIRRLRLRRHARLRGRRAGRRRGGACRAGRGARAAGAAERRGSRCGCIRSTIPPSSRTSPPSPGKAGQRSCATSWFPRWSPCRTWSGPARRWTQPARGQLPLHVLIESPAAVHRAFEIAAHPRVQSLSFGLMDFVSAHGGAIPVGRHGHRGPVHASAGGARQAGDRLGLPCARQGAVALRGDGIQGHESAGAQRRAGPRANSATRACGASTRTRSAPSWKPSRRVRTKSTRLRKIITAAARADWAPISFEGKLQDRASYRYYWQVLERAHRHRKAAALQRCWAGSQPGVI